MNKYTQYSCIYAKFMHITDKYAKNHKKFA